MALVTLRLALFTADFFGLNPYLPFKANFVGVPLFFTLCEFGGGAGISAVVGGLVTDVDINVGADGETRGSSGNLCFGLGFFEETSALEAHGAIGHPGVPGHLHYQIPVHVVDGLLRLHVAGKHLVKFLLVFGFQHFESAAQAVDEAILRDLIFHGLGLRSRAFLSVLAIGFEFTITDLLHLRFYSWLRVERGKGQ